MNRKFTSTENLKHKVQSKEIIPFPRKSTIDFLMQFARVYSVEKSKNSSFIELILN